MTETTPCARGCEVPGAHAIPHPAASSCPGCLRRPAMRGTTVCAHCADLLATALRDLRTAWPDLRVGVSRDRSSSTAGGAGAVQTSRVSDVGDYWRPDVTQILADVRTWLTYLADVLTDTPALRGTDLLGLTAEQLLVTFALHAKPVLQQQPALAAGIVKEALRIRGRAWRALNSSYVRRVPLKDATCLSDVYIDDPDAPEGVRSETCNGELVAVLQPVDAGGDSAILCSRFPREHRVRSDQWGALADQLEALAG